MRVAGDVKIDLESSGGASCQIRRASFFPPPDSSRSRDKATPQPPTSPARSRTIEIKLLTLKELEGHILAFRIA
jgi:hypothetical protein